jgi:rod shape-determining protein MreC
VARAVASGTRADVVLLAASVVLSLAALALPGPLRDPVAGTLRRAFVGPLITVQRNAELGRMALIRHDSETAVHDSVAMKALMVPELESENDRLRRTLGLGRSLGWGYVPAEALHSRALGEEFTVTLTRGERAGIRRFSPVVASEGLVGMVETVDPSMSLAIIWAHPDFRVSAMAADGSAFGIVKAHLGSGSERYLLELSGVQLSSALPPGTPIVSSGVGGVYPRGIPVGTVIAEIKTSEGWARTYLVRPAVKPFDITSVLVLQPKRVVAGVQSVWGEDSAHRSAAAAAADSAARGGVIVIPRDTIPDMPADTSDSGDAGETGDAGGGGGAAGGRTQR